MHAIADLHLTIAIPLAMMLKDKSERFHPPRQATGGSSKIAFSLTKGSSRESARLALLVAVQWGSEGMYPTLVAEEQRGPLEPF